MHRLISVTLYALIALAFIVGRYATPEHEALWFKEDGIIESVGAIAFLIASLAFLFVARAISRDRGGRHVLVALALSVLMLLACLEEISWGQRLFDWKTPEMIKSVNVQGETNIHNLKWFQLDEDSTFVESFMNANRMFAMFCAGFGIVLPMAYSQAPWVRRIARRFSIPIPSLWLGAGFAVTFIAFRLAISDQPRWLVSGLNELKEALYAVVLATIAVSMAYQSRHQERD